MRMLHDHDGSLAQSPDATAAARVAKIPRIAGGVLGNSAKVLRTRDSFCKKDDYYQKYI